MNEDLVLGLPVPPGLEVFVYSSRIGFQQEISIPSWTQSNQLGQPTARTEPGHKAQRSNRPRAPNERGSRPRHLISRSDETSDINAAARARWQGSPRPPQ